MSPETASGMAVWARLAGVEALSLKYFEGEWHGLAVAHGATISERGRTFIEALFRLVRAVELAS